MNITQKSKLMPIGLIILLGIAAIVIWSNRSISGTYIDQSENAVRMIRLVQTQDGKLSGQFESVILTNDGHIKNASASIEGNTDGNNINLTLNVSPLLPVPVTVSGTRDGNTITQTLGIFGEAPKTRTYINSDLKIFQSASDALRKKSQTLLLAQQEQKFTAGADKLVSRMQDLMSTMDVDSKKLIQGKTQYQNITSKEQTYYAKAQSMQGQRYFVQRTQVFVAMNQGVVATNQIHTEVKSIESDWSSKAPAVTKEGLEANQTCHEYEAHSIAMPICVKLKEIGNAYAEKLISMGKTFDVLEQTYQTELKQQQDLITKLQAIQ